jgi:hypothetical protein
MPRGDRTGPLGLGSMTGRGLGYCAGYATPGFTKGYFGQGLGFRRGFRRGLGRGFGLGFRGYYPSIGFTPPPTYQNIPPYQMPYGASVPYLPPTIITKEEQLKILADQKEFLEKQIADLTEEIKKIEEEK